MNTLRIDTGDRHAFEPRETIDVSVEWDLEGPPSSVELRLVWNTAGKGTTDVSIVRTVAFDQPSPHDARRATLSLPEGPYSFSGSLVSLEWALELVATPGDNSAREVITIAPERREVILSSCDSSPEFS